MQTWPRLTLLVNSQRLISHAIEVRLSGGMYLVPLTPMGSLADSPEPPLRPSPATGHAAEMLDV
jgi:hypothetical protein